MSNALVFGVAISLEVELSLSVSGCGLSSHHTTVCFMSGQKTMMDSFYVEISSDHTLAWTHLSHLSYDDFGRSENVQHYKIAMLFHCGRYLGWKKGILNYDEIVSDQFAFSILGTHITIQPAFCKIHRTMTFPFKISSELVDMGRTSATFYSQLINKLDNTELASSYCKVIYMNLSTRRPVPFPDSVQQKYAGVLWRRHVLDLPATLPEVPASAHCYDLKVAPSDVNSSDHTDHCSYLRFCCDAAQDAVLTGALHGFQTDIQNYPLTALKVIYLGETDTGNNLQVLLWQLPSCHNIIHIAIRRSGRDSQKSVIFHGYMVYKLKCASMSRI